MKKVSELVKFLKDPHSKKVQEQKDIMHRISRRFFRE